MASPRANFKIDFDARAISAAMGEAAEDVLETIAEDVAARAADLSPVAPKFGGTNRQSIGVVGKNGMIRGRQGAAEEPAPELQGQVAVVTTSGYGGYLEVGTRHMAPRHYIRQAVADTMTFYGQNSTAAKQVVAMAFERKLNRRLRGG